MSFSKTRAILIVQLLTIFTSCANQRQSVIDGRWSRDTDKYNWNVKIIAVDGVVLSFPKDQIDLKPGLHEILLLTTGPRKDDRATAQYYTIETKPCTKYYLSAQHEETIKSELWDVRALREEVLEHCQSSSDGLEQK